MDELDAQIPRWHRESAESRRLAAIPGIGPITASALAASLGDAKNFKDGRQVAAWLVPRQHSSGGEQAMRGISKRGDGYLRKLLVHGARAVIQVEERKAETADGWFVRLLRRRHKNVATMALANRNAHTVWALLAHDRDISTVTHPPWRVPD